MSVLTPEDLFDNMILFRKQALEKVIEFHETQIKQIQEEIKPIEAIEQMDHNNAS